MEGIITKNIKNKVLSVFLVCSILFACNINSVKAAPLNVLSEHQDTIYTDSLVYNRLPLDLLDSAFFTFIPESGSDSIPVYSGNLKFTTEYQSSGSDWHPQCIEEDVYLARMTHLSGDSTIWDLRIGKGGQIYSFIGPYGEGVPPQWRSWDFNTARWVDEVWQIVSVNSALNNAEAFIPPPGTTLGRQEVPSMKYFIHGAGIYMNDPVFLEYNKPFYSPIVACWFNKTEKAFYSTHWGQQAHVPSIHKSQLLYTYRYKDLGEGILEVTYIIQNFGNQLVNYHNMPWGGVRELNLPQSWLSKPDNSLERTYKSFSGEDPGIVGSIDETGGYFIWAADGDDENRPALAIIFGKDVHYNDLKYPYNMRSTRLRWGTTNDLNRSYSVFEVNQRLDILPGTTFFYRVYYVNGTMKEVYNKACSLVKACDYGFINLDPLSVPLTSIKTNDIGNVLKHDIKLFASPVPNMIPLFLMEDTSTGKRYISPDLYYNVTTMPFINPYNINDPEYETYEDRIVYKPYDGRIKYIRLLGYGVKKDKISANIRFALLDTLILDNSAIVLTDEFKNYIWIPLEYCDSCAVEVKPDPPEGMMLYNDFYEYQKIPWSQPVGLSFTDKVPNPDTSLANPSYNVARVVRGEGKWANVHFQFPQYLDLTVYNTFTLKAYFEGGDTVPDICNVRLILRNNGDGLTQYSVDANVVITNGWINYSYACPNAYLRNDYNQVWLFFSSPDETGITSGHTYYIDELMGPPLTIQSYDISTNITGDSIIIDFSDHENFLRIVSLPGFKLYRAGTEKIILDNISHDSSHIYLHVNPDQILTGRDQLTLDYKSGKIEDTDGYLLSYFTGKQVSNLILISLYNLKFIIKDTRTGYFLPEVSVSVDTSSGVTNMIGEFNCTLPEGSYNYSLVKQDYLPVSSVITVSGDTTIYLTMKSAYSDLQFKVYEGISPVYNADIEINGIIQQTNTVGLATFNNLSVNTEYLYSISKTGYHSYYGSIYLENDTTIEVILEIVNSINKLIYGKVNLYPLPPQDKLVIESSYPVQEIKLYNIYGQLKSTVKQNEKPLMLSVSELTSGIYFLEIYLENGNIVMKMFSK